MIRYRVKPDAPWRTRTRPAATPNCTGQPDGFRYANYQLDDGVSFVHVATHADEGRVRSPTGSFQWFQKDIADRCDEPPAF